MHRTTGAGACGRTFAGDCLRDGAHPSRRPRRRHARRADARRRTLVAFPTETVYGLGADAGNAAAVARIFEAKRRPADHPLIVHVADLEAAHRWAVAVRRRRVALADAFWPGPLTLIVPRAGHVHDIVTGGQPSVGLRVPSHPVAHALLTEFGNGIAAPSANRFGHVSPTTARHVADDLEDAVDLILDGGASTSASRARSSRSRPTRAMLLRPGGIGADAIAGRTGRTRSRSPIRRPRARRERWRRTTRRERLRISSTTMSCAPSSRNSRTATSASPCLRAPPSRPKRSTACGSPLRTTRPSYARTLYANLRALDDAEADAILVECVPDDARMGGDSRSPRRAPPPASTTTATRAC